MPHHSPKLTLKISWLLTRVRARRCLEPSLKLGHNSQSREQGTPNTHHEFHQKGVFVRLFAAVRLLPCKWVVSVLLVQDHAAVALTVEGA